MKYYVSETFALPREGGYIQSEDSNRVGCLLSLGGCQRLCGVESSVEREQNEEAIAAWARFHGQRFLQFIVAAVTPAVATVGKVVPHEGQMTIHSF